MSEEVSVLLRFFSILSNPLELKTKTSKRFDSNAEAF